jgi:hypothetical protein
LRINRTGLTICIAFGAIAILSTSRTAIKRFEQPSPTEPDAAQ